MDAFQRAVLENQIAIMNALASNADPIIEKHLDDRIESTKSLISYST